MTEREMMETEAYHRVVASPGRDLPREELAAWLDDRWPVRAQWIRLDLAHAWARRRRLSAWVELPESGIDILLANKRDWEEPARSLGWLKGWGFARGFISYVRMDATVFLQRAQELFSTFPIRHLDLQFAAPVIHDIAASPFVERLVGLGLPQNSLGDDQVQTLANSPRIRNLRWLDLRRNQIGPNGFEALASSPHLESLVDVSLTENAAPNPAQECGYEWTGAKHIDSLPRLGRELEQRYGYKRWLRGAELIGDYPPTFDAFDGDDPA